MLKIKQCMNKLKQYFDTNAWEQTLFELKFAEQLCKQENI